MKTTIVILAIIALVASHYRDTTTKCLPDYVTWDEINITSVDNLIVTVMVDFPKQQAAYLKFGSPIRQVHDFLTLTRYTILGDGKCWSEPLPKEEIIPQCLPADAKYLGNFTVGTGPKGIFTSGWSFPWGNIDVVMAFTLQPNQPSFPLVGKFTTKDSKFQFVQLFANPSTDFSPGDVFDVPKLCPSRAIELLI